MNILDSGCINNLLDIAEEGIELTTCLRRNYGAVIINGTSLDIISQGYTHSPVGWKVCSDFDSSHCYRIQHNIPSGSQYELCRSIHAEQMAIIDAQCDLHGSILFLVGKEIDGTYVKAARPCAICQKLLTYAGVVGLYVRKDMQEYEFTLVKDLETF